MDIHLFAYYGFILLGAAAAGAVGYLFARGSGFSKRISLGYILFALLAGILGALIMGKIQTLVISLTPLPNYPNRFRIFGGLLFMPPLLYFPVKYTYGDFRKITDIFTPGMYLLIGFSKLGCAGYGCCYGIEFEHGISSRFVDYKVFPVQLLESAVCFLLFFLLYFLIKKEKCRKGTVYPVSLILYGIFRFFVEFLRDYTPKERTYFLGMNFWQAVCVVTVVYAFVYYLKVLRNIPGTVNRQNDT